MINVFLVVGTRPEAIKMAPVYKACLQDPDVTPILVSTGQHKEMLDQVFDWFGLKPDEDLAIMEPSQTLSMVLSKAVSGLDGLIKKHKPDVVLAQGDTTTVISAALAAFHCEVPFGHVEAGLRTHDLARPFPEEGYRQMAQRLARWNFAPTQKAMDVLASENLSGQAHKVGNTVIDALLETASKDHPLPLELTRNKLVLITGHRRENHGERFREAFGAIAQLAHEFEDVDFVYPVHLNPQVKVIAHEILQGIDNFHLLPPVSYPEIVELMKRAYLILTDSGGIQEEAPSFKVPVLVMRDSTERQECVEANVSKLVGVDPAVILREATRLLTDNKAYADMRRFSIAKWVFMLAHIRISLII
ncbi:MAG: UDP-N-acetylglucosamine 2-epimerase (non-hydrolyzing), partial [Litorimonas sp.]